MSRRSSKIRKVVKETPYQEYKRKMEAIREKYLSGLANKLVHGNGKKKKKLRPFRKVKQKKQKHPRPPVLRGSVNYDDYLVSPTWKKVRLWVLELAGWQCEACGAKGRLDVHHLSYERLGREKRKDLRVLCRPCHKYVHQTDLANQEHLRRINDRS